MTDKASPPKVPNPDAGEWRQVPLWQRVLVRYKQFGFFAKVAIWLIVASPLVVVVGYKVVRPVYRHLKQANALRLGEQYAAQGDAAAAMMSFRKAIRTNSRNADAWRRVAVYLDELGSEDAIGVWGQVVRLNKDDADARFNQIEAAIDHHRKREAREALEEIPEEARGSARYFYAMGALAAEEGDFRSALQYFDKTADADPGLDGLSIRHDIARLREGDLSQRVEASESLEALGKEDRKEGAQALRELFADAVQRNDNVSSRVYAERLMEHPKAELRDRLVRADFELRSGGTFFPVVLQQLREAGEKNPDEIPGIVSYLLARGRIADAVNWLDGFPEDATNLPQLRPARFEVALAQQDWETAFAVMEAGEGEGAIPGEAVARAKEAFEVLETRRGDATGAWQKAIAASENSPAAMLALVKLSKARGWEDAQVKVLWAFVRRQPDAAELWYELIRIETGRRNLHAMYQAVPGALRAAPDNLALRSNFVIVSYLLGKGDPAGLLEMAAGAYEEAPKNPFFVTSYAVALMNAGDTQKAIELIEQLSPADLAVPERALYRGAIYAAGARPEDARASLALAESALDRMLPEEILLHRSIVAKLDGKSLTNEDVLAALKSSGASEEEKAQLAEALRAGRTQRSEDAGKLAEQLREGRVSRGQDTFDMIEELGEQRAERARSQEEVKALIDEIRAAPAVQEETN